MCESKQLNTTYNSRILSFHRSPFRFGITEVVGTLFTFMIKVLIPLFGTHRHTLVDELSARKVGRFEYEVHDSKSVDLKVRESQKSRV